MAHPTIKKGSHGDAVKLAQTRLKQRGYDPGAIDGDFGQKTEAAVKAYQTDRHPPKPLTLSFPLAVDGVVGPKTWFRLDPEQLKKGAHGPAVKLLQELLKLAGSDPGPIDSDFGSKTEAAVKAFQQGHKDFENKPLLVDGVVGIRTWAALKS
ncbi:MAG: peptidoglycan-binding protein [Alphaproteobacteria bacterium]|nr:peptidoglycan-binding protein [Alphaproteobacteria bacterium]